MAGIGADIWVCGNCRSVNNLRAKQCYHCRTPQQIAAVDPAAIEGTGHGTLREIQLPEFDSSRGAAMLASALIIVVAVMQIVSTIVTAQALSKFANEIELGMEIAPGRLSELMTAGFVGLATIGFGLLALTGWAFWLSRTVVAMPALGLGYPAANGLMAFVENFLPGLNLLRVPAIVRDVIRRLEPGNNRGEVLIFAAWIGLFGGLILPRVAPFLPFGADTLEGQLRSGIAVQAISTVLVVLGAIFLVVLIWWIEDRIARRRTAQLAGEAAPASTGAAPSEGVPTTAAAATTAAQPDVASRPLAQRAPFAPVGPTEVTPVAPERPFAQTSAAFGSGAVVAPAAVAGPLGAMPSAASVDMFVNRPITAATGVSSLPDLDVPSVAPHEHPDVERFADARPVWADAPMPSATPVEPTPETSAPEPSAPVEVEPAEPLASVEPMAPVEPAEDGREVEPRTDAPVDTDEPIAIDDAALVAETPIIPPAAPIAESPTVPPPLAHVPTGPSLLIRVESGTAMIATLDGVSEPIIMDELRTAAGALARADGSAEVMTTTETFEARSLARQVVEVLSHAGVPTTLQD